MVERSQATLASVIPDLCEGEDCQAVFWPPDVFAQTSKALKLTGAYRHATNLDEDPPWPPTEEWSRTVLKEADAWWSYLFRRAVGVCEHPPKRRNELAILSSSLQMLKEHADRTIDDLTFIGGRDTTEHNRSDVSQALLKLHSLADQACAGFGVLHAPRDRAVAHFLANSLLAETGTLSTRPRAEGLVLPKMRTAQVGLTLRSFSHHLTFHQSEVQVIWRAMPWANIDENTLNILIMPWPFEVEARDFQVRASLGKARSVGNARFFEYAPERPFKPELLLSYLRQAHNHVGRIHLIVLPELALTPEELSRTKARLVEELKNITEIPMILTGVRSSARRAPGAGRAFSGSNKLVLSALFAGRWYDLNQEKHHRWRIDDNQILQYGLGGILSGGQEWWEGIDIPNRRLSFLVPNGWLALAPLICEDLARLDPISEIVRGVGPTLVVALLFDGPQLKARWSGRYAAVLTDDPGSSVLSVTSLGMARRSRIPDLTTSSMASTMGLTNVALWKDQVRGWHEVDLPNAQAAVLTITAAWMEEFTADGRSDGINAARFVFEGSHALGDANQTRPANPTLEGEEPPEEAAAPQEKDLLEVASLTCMVDGMLDATPDDRSLIARIATDEKGKPARKPRRGGPPISTTVARVHDVLRRRSPVRGGREGDGPTNGSHVHSLEYKLAVGLVLQRLGSTTTEPKEEVEAQLKRYEGIVKGCERRLTILRQPDTHKTRPNVKELLENSRQGSVETTEAARVSYAVDLSLLWAVHNRIASRRRHARMGPRWALLLDRVETELQQPVPDWTHRITPARPPSKRSKATKKDATSVGPKPRTTARRPLYRRRLPKPTQRKNKRTGGKQ